MLPASRGFSLIWLMDRLRDVLRVLWWSLFPSRAWLAFH